MVCVPTAVAQPRHHCLALSPGDRYLVGNPNVHSVDTVPCPPDQRLSRQVLCGVSCTLVKTRCMFEDCPAFSPTDKTWKHF